MYFTRKRSTEVLLWVLIPCLIATINATTEILEAVREGQEIAYWKPFVGEFSSVFVVLMLLPGILLIDQRWPIGSDRWPRHLMMHLPLSVFFSILHIAGMMGIRSVVYALMGEVYKFGEVGLLLIYEYRKDFVLYAVILITLYAYRELVRLRLGEAQLAAPDDSNVAEQADENRILVSKSGLFHFIDPKAIHWVEAAGNYVELHTASETYMSVSYTHLTLPTIYSV